MTVFVVCNWKHLTNSNVNCSPSSLVDHDLLEEEETITQGSDDGGDSDSDCEYHDLPSSSSHHNNKVSPATSHSENMVTSSQSCPKAKSKNIQVKRPWSGEEAAAVQRHLASCLILNQTPKKHACERALAAEPVPQKRTWKDLKYFVYNLLKKANTSNRK